MKGGQGSARGVRHLVLMAILSVLGTAASARTVRLDEALNKLAAEGHHVLFAAEVIGPSTTLELDDIDLGEVRRALAEIGFDLERVGRQWVIVRIPPPPAAGTADDDAQPRNPPVLESVIVTGTRHRLAGEGAAGSVSTLSAEDLNTVPSLGGDAIRAAAALPGMSSIGVSAKPQIRGGLQDELLVRIDGVEMLEAYHLADFQNIFSIVDDRAVNAIDVYTGGFPARYGNRMSGVIEITTGRSPAEPRREIGVSMFSLLANAQGRAGDVDYLVSARRGNLDQVLKRVDSSLGRPRYHDAFARARHALTPEASITVGGFLSHDDATLTEDETVASSKIDSGHLWARLELDHGGGLASSATLAYGRSDRHKRQYDLDDSSGAGGELDHRQRVRKLSARADVAWEHDDARMEFGVDVEHGAADYDSFAFVDRGAVGVALSGSAVRAHDLHLDPEGWSGGAYWAGDFAVGGGWRLQPGLRYDVQDYDPHGSRDQLSPRLGIRYAPTGRLTLHGVIGRFHQPEALNELPVADGVAEFSAPQRADHYILGGEWLSARWTVTAAAYQKRYGRTKGRFENLFNPFVLVPELEPDRVLIQPKRARARGADLELRRQLSERAALLLRYGYLDAEDRLDGRWVPRRWSQRHTAHGMLSWQDERLTAALAVTWHSGWRGSLLPASVDEGATLNVAEWLNNRDLDDYVSVDVSVRRSWPMGRSRLTLFASVTNLLDRGNVAGIDYDAEAEDGVVSLTPARETLLPRVPSVGVLISF